jgi:hypothetical protein
LTTLLALVLGLACPLVLGLPLVGAVAQRVVFKRPQPATPDARVQAAVVRTFTPLDLGPDLVRWPSEAPVKLTQFPEPPWPSERWDDPHFGRKRAIAVPHAAPKEPVDKPAKPQKARPAPAPAPAEQAFFEAGVQGQPSGLAGLSDAKIKALVDREGLVKAVEILVERAGVDPGTVARELRRILAGKR